MWSSRTLRSCQLQWDCFHLPLPTRVCHHHHHHPHICHLPSCFLMFGTFLPKCLGLKEVGDVLEGTFLFCATNPMEDSTPWRTLLWCCSQPHGGLYSTLLWCCSHPFPAELDLVFHFCFLVPFEFWCERSGTLEPCCDWPTDAAFVSAPGGVATWDASHNALWPRWSVAGEFDSRSLLNGKAVAWHLGNSV